MTKVYFKFDAEKRLREIKNGLDVIVARQKDIEKKLKKGGLSVSESIELIKEMSEAFKQAQAYKEESDEIMKILMIRKMMEEES